MKKLLSLLLVLAILSLSLVACGGAGGTSETPSDTENDSVDETQSASDSAAESESEDDGMVAYTVTVLYPDGTPAAGVYVQMCLGTSCQFPQATDANGVLTVRQTPDDAWEVKLPQIPAGYTTDAPSYTFDAEGCVTVTLVAVEG